MSEGGHHGEVRALRRYGMEVSEMPPALGIFHDPISLPKFSFLTVAETHFP